MRLLFLHQYFNTPSMSGSTRSFEMAKRLVAAGHSVVMLTTDRGADGKGWRVSDEQGIEVHWHSNPYSNDMSYAKRIISFFRFVFSAFARSLRLDFELVFATSTPLTIAIPGIWAARRKRVPFVFEVRDLWPAVPIALGALRGPLAIRAAEALERFAYRNSARIVALAPGMKEHIVRKGVDPEIVTVIPNGCDAYLFGGASAGGPDLGPLGTVLRGKRVMLYAGTLGMVNGTEWIVRIAAAVLGIDPEIRFVFIGEGRKKEDTVALARSNGTLDENVFFLPSMTKRDVAPWTIRCDAAFVTMEGPEFYVRDSVCNKFFDAISAGKPVLANHRGFSTELAERSGCARILPADPVEAAKSLVATVRDAEWMASAGRAAVMLASTVFDRDNQAKDLIRVLEEALEGGRASDRDSGEKAK